jgi:hypothetical protein
MLLYQNRKYAPWKAVHREMSKSLCKCFTRNAAFICHKNFCSCKKIIIRSAYNSIFLNWAKGEITFSEAFLHTLHIWAPKRILNSFASKHLKRFAVCGFEHPISSIENQARFIHDNHFLLFY